CVTLPAPAALYTLSLHDALPICRRSALPARPTVIRRAAPATRRDSRAPTQPEGARARRAADRGPAVPAAQGDQIAATGNLHEHGDRKSTRLNSSHVKSSYAVFCL